MFDGRLRHKIVLAKLWFGTVLIITFVYCTCAEFVKYRLIIFEIDIKFILCLFLRVGLGCVDHRNGWGMHVVGLPVVFGVTGAHVVVVYGWIVMVFTERVIFSDVMLFPVVIGQTMMVLGFILIYDVVLDDVTVFS